MNSFFKVPVQGPIMTKNLMYHVLSRGQILNNELKERMNERKKQIETNKQRKEKERLRETQNFKKCQEMK